jgi:molecular chaperone GrpE
MNKETEKQIDITDSRDSEPQIHAATDAEMEALNAEAIGQGTQEAAPTIESLQAELAEAEKRVLLAHADLENFRRRNRREMQDQLRYASLGLMNEILEAVDNLQRAIDSYEKEPNGEGLVEGVKLVAHQINTSLENNGCKKIDAVGQPFDPNLHQAIQMQPSEEHDANVVSADVRTGFQLHDRVIRPSQVFVSTGPKKN